MTDPGDACSTPHRDAQSVRASSAGPRWVPLCKPDAVKLSGALRIEADGFEPLAVFHADGTFFVTADACSHGDASLSEGTVSDGQVECPWHSGAFCLRTGEPTAFPAVIPIRTYPASLIDGFVCIERAAGDEQV